MPGHYFRVYMDFIRTSWAEALTYRAHFILLIIMDLLFYATALAGVAVIYEHLETIGPWNKNQFMFFVAFMLAVDHIHMTLVSENYWNFAFELRQGTFDFHLIRPIGSLFPVFFRLIRPASFFNIMVPWGVLIWYGLEIQLSPLAWVLLPFMVLLAFALLTSLEILIIMGVFITVESYGLNFLRIQLQQMARWPDFVFRFYARKVFTLLVPVLLIGSVPVRFLLNPLQPEVLLPLVVALAVIVVLIRFCWRLGLRTYESASS